LPVRVEREKTSQPTTTPIDIPTARTSEARVK